MCLFCTQMDSNGTAMMTRDEYLNYCIIVLVGGKNRRPRRKNLPIMINQEEQA